MRHSNKSVQFDVLRNVLWSFFSSMMSPCQHGICKDPVDLFKKKTRDFISENSFIGGSDTLVVIDPDHEARGGGLKSPYGQIFISTYDEFECV